LEAKFIAAYFEADVERLIEIRTDTQVRAVPFGGALKVGYAVDAGAEAEQGSGHVVEVVEIVYGL
jgi:hypothetical protein